MRGSSHTDSFDSSTADSDGAGTMTVRPGNRVEDTSLFRFFTAVHARISFVGF